VTPRVRVVVLNHNGGDLTIDCLHRLLHTDWPAPQLEVVLVDNASDDGVVARVRRELPVVDVRESATNLGFAGGCNLALRDLTGVDYVALVNNDVLVEPGWLRPLADALDADPGLGAASPKILLSAPMLDVEIRVAHTFRLGRGDRRDLGVRLSGVRVNGDDCTTLARHVRGFWGPELGGADEPAYQWTGADALVRVPVSETGEHKCELRLAAHGTVTVELQSGSQRGTHEVGPEPRWYPATLDGVPTDVINNVGSLLTQDWYGADRGYLERDAGQYDEPEDVFAWCGAAVLLRRAYLDDVGLFDERLFLYYEDLELAWRGRECGWQYRYVPDSMVRHLHSATSVEGSRLTNHYNERNRLLVLTRHARAEVLARVLGRYVLVTASYGRRDVIAPWSRKQRVSWESVRRRTQALYDYLRMAPAELKARRES
jgi:GT2 family glycosyltransferase